MKNFLPAKYSIIGSYYRNNASTTALLVKSWNKENPYNNIFQG